MTSITQGGRDFYEKHSPFDMSGDILRGADKIAEFLFGDPKLRRKVYHLVETGRLPVFRLGTTICARKSTLVAFIEQQEHATKPASNLEAA